MRASLAPPSTVGRHARSTPAPFNRTQTTHRRCAVVARDARFRPLFEQLAIASESSDKALPNEAFLDLLETVTERSEAQQFAGLASADLRKRLQVPGKSWPQRKKLYSAYSYRALQLGAGDILLALLTDPASAALEKYFIADLIWELGTSGVDTEFLVRLLELQRAKALADPTTIKGLRRAYWELLKTCDVRQQQGRMGTLYLQAKQDGVTFTEAFTAKLEGLAAVAAAAPVAAV